MPPPVPEKLAKQIFDCAVTKAVSDVRMHGPAHQRVAVLCDAMIRIGLEQMPAGLTFVSPVCIRSRDGAFPLTL
jgi:hypothetical protein